MAMYYLESASTDPTYNLALEEYVFNELPRTGEYFMLWRNHNAIVVGKHQNTAEEVCLPFVRQHNVKVVRRLSGGGAVYHDLGNLNYTFVRDASGGQLDLAAFCVPVVQALHHLGVEAVLSGRNDITIDGKKFSGNAQYLREGRVMHHGTLMFDSDLEVLANALNVSADKIESKGVKSVRSRVTNIRAHLKRDMSVSEFKSVLLDYMIKANGMRPYPLTPQDQEGILALKRLRYDTWDWNYGASPPFRIRKERRVEGCGILQIFMEAEGGVITAFSVRGDFFSTGDPDELGRALLGVRLREEDLSTALADLDVDFYFKNLNRNGLIDIILQ
ncbi:Lipoate-protein ligase LplJ [bioreactor metagenome]|uniref:lipoate--protein ligase n=1 Tax=bioreactor metagenome TaxID=1076179 RepID=A0A644VV87_9ZZZZ